MTFADDGQTLMKAATLHGVSGESLSITVQPVYKVVRIQGMSAYSVRSPGPDSCVFICDDIFIHIRDPLIRNFCF